MNEKVEELRRIVSEDPGAEEFVELASLLGESPEGRAEAREVCFRGLTETPQNLRGRLLLARLFYLDGMADFCLKELVQLKKFSSVPSLERLIDSFGQRAEGFLSENGERDDGASGEEEDKVFGEMDVEVDIDLDSEFDEALDEISGTSSDDD